MFECYRGKKVLITGHTGFKGGWLSVWLKSLGAEVLGYALAPETDPCLFEAISLSSEIKSVFGDICDEKHLQGVFQEFKPDFVFHLAAQPLVRRSYFEPVLTYRTNVMGTLNVLEAARTCESVKAFVNVTTDKCYENKETKTGYKEDDPMGGYDMYSSSKGCVEIMSSSYRRSFLQGADTFNMATARAGNVIGGGDWAKDRLVPDCVRALHSGQKIELRNPSSVRPWQHVLEPLSGYLLLGEKLFSQNGREYAQGFNFGPDETSLLTVEEVVKKFVEQWGSGSYCVTASDGLHEAGLLNLNIDKAFAVLGWKPVYNADKAVQKTVEWYRAFYDNKNMYDFTIKQIREYEENLDGKTFA